MPRLRAAPGIPLRPHSGGHKGCKRTSYHYHNGRFQCGQVNVLTAFTYVGPGDGGTVVIPGSHKSNIVHPAFTQTDRVKDWSELGGASSDGIPGAVEVEMAAGDAIVFVDATCHGSARRVNPGERRHSVYRYGSAWNRTRFGYHASPELLQRLSPEARKLIHPREYIRPPDTPTRW
jgi:ectoine hydroxylase-related dioxygenase (phytanoyl-CoA dioxygenase family)